jgi:hypothetical protein
MRSAPRLYNEDELEKLVSWSEVARIPEWWDNKVTGEGQQKCVRPELVSRKSEFGVSGWEPWVALLDTATKQLTKR